MRPKIILTTGVEPYSDNSGFAVDIEVSWDRETGQVEITVDKATVINAEHWDALKAEIDRALEYIWSRP